MLKFLAKISRLVAVISLFCGLLTFLIWNQLLHHIRSDRKETVSAAIQRNSNLAVSLEQYAIRTIRNADAVLQLVKMEYEKNGKDFDFNTLLHRGVIDLQYFSNVVIIDREGRLKYSNTLLKPTAALHFSDRAHFSFHKTNRDRLYISKPLASRTLGKGVIVVSRRIDGPEGSFSGTVAVQIEPSTFTQFYSKADLGRHDIISLIAPDGITYARRTGSKESYGEDISKSPLFRHLARKPVSHYFSRDAIHGIPTYFSYRKLEDYPMIATVGAAETEVLAGHLARARREYLFGAIVTLLLLVFSFLVANVLIQRKRVTKRIRISENRYRSIFENSQDAIIVLLPDGKIKTMNEAAGNLFRAGRALASGRDVSVLFSQAQPDILQGQLGLDMPYPQKQEVAFTRTDGSLFTGEVVYSSYQDYFGASRFVLMIRDISFRKEMEARLLEEHNRYQQMLTKQVILAQEREREAIGREMHDNVNQVLTSVKLYLEMAASNPPMREKLLPRSIHYLTLCIAEIRDLSRALSAPTLGTQSLIDSVNALVEMVASSSGLSIHFNYENYHAPIAKEQRLAIYRILQEQLNNIIKHAAATEVDIIITQQERTTELRISDNGKGFDVAADRDGIGLNNILSRAKVLGGEMLIDSRKGRGTVLKVLLPIVPHAMATRADQTLRSKV